MLTKINNKINQPYYRKCAAGCCGPKFIVKLLINRFSIKFICIYHYNTLPPPFIINTPLNNYLPKI